MYLFLSLIAAVLITFLVLTVPPPVTALSFSEKGGIAGIFIICCLGGISFVFRPNWLRRFLSISQSQGKSERQMGKRTIRGHHPDCSTFQSHTVHWRGKTWCAGCVGLFIGLCVAILMMLLYIVTDVQLIKMTSYLLLAVGFLIISSVFLEGAYPSRRPLFHVLSNSMLPVSFAFVTITVGGVTGTVVYGFFTILLCVLWLDTRIHLSKWRHRFLCTSCAESCKMYPVAG